MQPGFPEKPQAASLSGLRRRSQVVRQRSAKPPFVGSIPTGASLARLKSLLGTLWLRHRCFTLLRVPNQGHAEGRFDIRSVGVT